MSLLILGVLVPVAVSDVPFCHIIGPLCILFLPPPLSQNFLQLFGHLNKSYRNIWHTSINCKHFL